MESLPPMAPAPRSIWAIRAPRTAATGSPQRSGWVRRRSSKHSWKERYAFARSKPCGDELGHALYDGEVGAGKPVWPQVEEEGLKPQDMADAVVVSPSTGNLATIASEGVSCVLPPKGMSTVAAPMVESKRSARPLLRGDVEVGDERGHALSERRAPPSWAATRCGRPHGPPDAWVRRWS